MLKWNQDHHLLWKLTNQDPIIFAKLSTLIIYWRREKSDSYEGSDSNKNESFCSEDGMVSKGSNYETDENESQQEVSPRFDQNKIREKIGGYYDAGISNPRSLQMLFLGLYQQNL